MKQSVSKRVLAAIKGFFTKNKALKLCYLFIIIFLFYAPSFCEHTKITTPARDAYYLYEEAQCIETEADLLNWECKRQAMELEYSKRYNGAMAIKFRIMTEHIYQEVANRRDSFRVMETAEYNAEQNLATKLSNLGAAWQIKIGSENEALTEYTALLDKIVATHMELRAAVIEASEYSAKVMDGDYTQTQLNKQQEYKKRVNNLVAELADYRSDACQYNLAYKLKYRKSFSNSMLLQRYIDAFDGKNTRYSHSGDEEYGDVVYLAELYSLVGSQEELDKVEEIKHQILDAYRNSVMSGDASTVENEVTVYYDAALAHLAELEEIKSCSDYFYSINWDAHWESICGESNASAEESVEVDGVEFDIEGAVDDIEEVAVEELPASEELYSESPVDWGEL